MDPNVNGVWSASEIDMVKSLITSHITNKTYTNNTNKKHILDFVVDLQAMFPRKEKHHVTDLFVDLVVKIMMARSNNQHVVASNALVNGNFRMPLEPMDNMDKMQGYPMDDMEARKLLEEQPHMPNVVPKKRGYAMKYWATDEHRNFLRGLKAFGSGEWNSISKYFVPTKTPVQISSHAEKYFRRLECRRQCLNMNNVSLHDKQPWGQNNHCSGEALTFSGDAYNTNYYGFNGQYVAFNNLTHSSHASNNQVAKWSMDQQTTTSSSIALQIEEAIALVMEEARSKTTNNDHQLGGFPHNQGMDMDNID